MVPGMCRCSSARAAAVITSIACAAFGLSSTAFAQTTLILSAPNTQVVDAMIRNGSYRDIPTDGPLLLTRSSTVPDWERRSLLGFETASIPTGSPVSSALLTLTVKSGLGAAGTTRPVTVYRLTAAFIESQATWRSRQTGVLWTTAGGDLGESYSSAQVTNTVGTRVTFDVTELVQRTVLGEFGSSQVRVALVDSGGGGDAKESYREYASSDSSPSGDRPRLTIVYGTTNPGVVDVPPDGDLQHALNFVARGGTVRLTAGATYVGNFKLPARSGTDYITITTGMVSLPQPGTRIDPSYRTSLATIRSPTQSPALSTAPGASYYRVVGLSFDANLNGAGDVIALGDHTQTDLSQVPHHLEIDRVLVTGDAAIGQKRGISANATDVVIMNSDIRDIKARGVDSQAIALWNTPGPVVIRNNYLEAAGENILIGGALVTLPGVVPSDITVEGNLLTKDLLWRGTTWTVKNILELKSGRRVLVRQNTLEYNWSGSQPGYAIVMTPRSSSGRNSWIVIEDVEFSENVLRHSGGAFNILGYDDSASSGQLARVIIRNNLVYDISSTAWGGSGVFAQIGGEPRDITIDHNTIVHNGNAVTFYSGSYINAAGARVNGGPIQGFVFTNNFLKHNAYGLFGSGQAYGNGSLNYYTPGAVVRRNVLAGGSASRYPADNFFPSAASFLLSFVNPSSADYRLVTGSPYIAAGLDGADVGCSVADVFALGQR